MSVSGDAAALREKIAGHFLPDPPKCLGVAVSGGSDSLALLALLHDWAQAGGPALRAVTVDHGLRAEAAQEAEEVRGVCASLGVAHDTLTLDLPGQGGNLMDAARRGRYAALADWAGAQGIADIALGHTADDVAETFLMRLGRGAGLDGLSAMVARRRLGGVTIHRPMLALSRAELRKFLRLRGLGWAEDPTNDDPAFDRTRARAALAVLEPLGIGRATLSGVARNLREAREALGQCAARAAEECLRFDAGDVLLERAPLRDQPAEIVRRLLNAALSWVAGEGYPPRGKALGRLVEAARAGEETALHGCRMLMRGGNLRICREWKAVADLRAPVTALWDGRWQLHGPQVPGLHIAALGEAGLGGCPDRRATGRPAASLIASPAVWRGAELIAAPLAGLENGWSATLTREEDTFIATLLSH